MSRVFISYRRLDSEGYVGRLYDHLIQHFEPRDIFMDVDDIQPGTDFVKTLEDAVAGCDVLLAVIGPQWLNIADEAGNRRLDNPNDFVRIEVASALRMGKLVMPVLVGRAAMPVPDDLPDDLKPLARRNAMELSHQRFNYDIAQLVKALQNTAPIRGKAKPPASAETIRKKKAAIKAVRTDLVNATTSPLYEYRQANRYIPIVGDGNPDANIFFIGQAPGKNEVEQGRPFMGPSGEVLDEMLRGINLKRDDVFMTNVLLDRSPDNRAPTPVEIAFYTPFVDRLIDIILPSVMVTLGRFAMEYICKKFNLPEKKGKISELHGTLLKTQWRYGEIHIVPLYHPAVVLYSTPTKEVLRQDFEKLKLFI